MSHRCAYCRGKFGLVRHRRAFKAFCSKRCLARYKVCVQAALEHKGWVDYLLGSAPPRAAEIKHAS